MPRNTAGLVEQYIAALRTAHSIGAQTAETTFYTPLANLFNAVGETLKPRVHFQAHPGTHGAGLADDGFFPLARNTQRGPLPGQLPERGAVEIKPPGHYLGALVQSEQVRRYLAAYGLCLITNYHQFQLLELRHSQPHVLESYDLTGTAEALWSLPLRQLTSQHTHTLPDFLARVMTRKVPLENPKDVAWLLASYAREARARAETHPLAAFEGVKSALQESLGITFEGEKGEHFFLSALIQTLFYGIFSAWVLWRRSPEGRREGAMYDWRLSAHYLRVPVLRTLFHTVSEPGALNTGQIAEVLDHATEALNRVQPAFFSTFREEEAVNYFYEPFLEAFDPELRKQLGVWYTPREIVRYMVERVDHLLRTELNEPLGLASANVQVLDPCCGTGAYLVEVLHRIQRTLAERAGDDNALVAADLRRAATTRIFGFEIMPAPFVIAHLQIAGLLEDAGASLAETQRAQVFLTNALTGWVPVRHPQSTFGFPAFIEERDSAEAVKQADTILVILGNPPYNGYAGIAKIEEERDLTTAYRTPVAGLSAPQGQGLNDLYIRFFRIAERRIVGDNQARGNPDGRGIVAFISNNAWLDGLSHVSMRARYLREFQSIYIDNLNGDKYRTGKTTPDGKPDPSAFSTAQNREGIQVGTAVATLVRTAPSVHCHLDADRTLVREAEGPASAQGHIVHLRNLWGTHKLSHLDLEARREAVPEYEELTPAAALGLPFAERVHSAAYTSWPRLPELFPVSFPGIKTSRDPLVIDIDRHRLVERMKQYFDPGVADGAIEELSPRSMEDGYLYPAKEIRRTLQVRGFREWEVVPYSYRPFDVRWIYWEPEGTLLRRKVEDFMAQLIGGTKWIEARQREAGESFSRGTLVNGLADNFGNGYSSFFPAVVIDDRRRITGLLPTDLNLSRAAESYLSKLNVLTQLSSASGREAYHATPKKLIFSLVGHELFFHALATMHTPQYRTENAGALLNDWPRIPLPATAELLTHSAELGRRLAELLDPESNIELVAEWSFLARLVLPLQFPEGTPERDRRNAERLALTAGWGGAGQGATVMPRRGDARERDWTAQERERLSTLAATQSLALQDALNLLGERCVDVYLNGDAYWSGVPVNVWEYTLGGYQVLKKWLSYRELPLLGRPLREDEARYFAQVVRRIAAILLMGSALDASYAAILPTATGLPS